MLYRAVSIPNNCHGKEHHDAKYTHVEKSDHESKLEIDCGNIQPGRKVWKDEIHLAIVDSGEIQIDGNLFAANLRRSHGNDRERIKRSGRP